MSEKYTFQVWNEHTKDFMFEIKEDGHTMFPEDIVMKLNQNSANWIQVKKQLPSVKNGFIDELVLIRVRNKNKEDGIFLYDVCAFDGESWCDRLHTWEDIVDWKPIS